MTRPQRMKKIFGPHKNKTGITMDDTANSLYRAELTAETRGEDLKPSSETTNDTHKH
jgi:hypothetical protein